MNSGEKVKHGALWSVLFAVVSLAWIFPIVLVIINSFKQKTAYEITGCDWSSDVCSSDLATACLRCR